MDVKQFLTLATVGHRPNSFEHQKHQKLYALSDLHQKIKMRPHRRMFLSTRNSVLKFIEIIKTKTMPHKIDPFTKITAASSHVKSLLTIIISRSKTQSSFKVPSERS